MNTKEISFSKELSDFIFVNKYARYNPLAERRETWEECIDRSYTMHHNKFRKVLSKEDMAEVKWAFQMVKDKKVVPSLRSLQFGGPAIEAHAAKMYNCSMRHVDSLRSFAEIFYLFLNGCGVGIGLSKFFLNRLPDLVNEKDKTGTVMTYVIEDTIEGWADSVEALLMCYFKNTPYTGRKAVFDYSKVRKEGTPLKTTGGKSPGYRGLKACHTKIKALLDHIIEDLEQPRLKTINAYDILMHEADATLSGGIRRSASSIIFEYEDEDMLNAKTYFTCSKHTKFYQIDDTIYWEGKVTVNKKQYEIKIEQWEYEKLLKDKTISWLHIEPQRARSNNSVLLDRATVTEEQFKTIIQRTKEFGEPGFAFGVKNQLFNPCQPPNAEVLTPEGIRQFKDIDKGSIIWSETGWTKVINKWSNGVKPVFKYTTEDKGVFLGTDNHRVVEKGKKIEVKQATHIDFLGWPINEQPPTNINKPSKIVAIEGLGEAEVFDITVDNDTHTYWTGGLNVSNCMEIGTIPLTLDMVAGVQFCNLSSMNGAKIKSKEDFMLAVKAATIIGTLQATYTDFKYISNTSKQLTEEEALLGVSITGIMDNPQILLDEHVLQAGAKLTCDLNEEWAKKLNIRPAARTTCVKPEGTSSLVLESASGIHPHHARQYFRRVQCNKLDPIYKYFKKINPHMCEEGVWSANKTDDVITFPLTVGPEAIIKPDLTAIQHLEIIKKMYKNWVLPGTTKYNKKPLTHNISCTVIVKPEEWVEVTKYLFDNKESFAAVSFLPATGDKDYKQAPLEAITTDEDRAKWANIVANYKTVDYTKLIEANDQTKALDTVSCAGGACEII